MTGRKTGSAPVDRHRRSGSPPYVFDMALFRSLFDMLPVMRLRRAQEAVVDAEAISLIRSAADDEAAYRAAREIMRVAHERGDRESARLFARVAMRIAAVTGRQIGQSRDVGERYQQPTLRIKGDRTVKS